MREAMSRKKNREGTNCQERRIDVDVDVKEGVDLKIKLFQLEQAMKVMIVNSH